MQQQNSFIVVKVWMFIMSAFAHFQTWNSCLLFCQAMGTREVIIGEPPFWSAHTASWLVRQRCLLIGQSSTSNFSAEETWNQNLKKWATALVSLPIGLLFPVWSSQDPIKQFSESWDSPALRQKDTGPVYLGSCGLSYLPKNWMTEWLTDYIAVLHSWLCHFYFLYFFLDR